MSITYRTWIVMCNTCIYIYVNWKSGKVLDENWCPPYKWKRIHIIIRQYLSRGRHILRRLFFPFFVKVLIIVIVHKDNIVSFGSMMLMLYGVLVINEYKRWWKQIHNLSSNITSGFYYRIKSIFIVINIENLSNVLNKRPSSTVVFITVATVIMLKIFIESHYSM